MIDNAVTQLPTHNRAAQARVDRIGIVASVLCAIHCALTPVLLIMMPTFGKAWSHPSTHWGMAIIVIPIAIYMMRKGYQTHAKKWIVVTASVGIFCIVVGAILPYVELDSSSRNISPVPAIVETTQVEEQPESGVCELAASSG